MESILGDASTAYVIQDFKHAVADREGSVVPRDSIVEVKAIVITVASFIDSSTCVGSLPVQ